VFNKTSNTALQQCCDTEGRGLYNLAEEQQKLIFCLLPNEDKLTV